MRRGPLHTHGWVERPPGRTIVALQTCRQLEGRLVAVYWDDPELVFASAVGTKLDRRNVPRWWHELTYRGRGGPGDGSLRRATPRLRWTEVAVTVATT
jgi:hypothetical protein